MSCVILLYPQNSIQKAGKTVGMGRMVEGKRKGKHGRKDPWPPVQSDSGEDEEAEEEAKPFWHISYPFLAALSL